VELDLDASANFLTVWDDLCKTEPLMPMLVVHATSAVRYLVARGAYILMSCRSFTRHARSALATVPLSRALFATMDAGLYYSLTEPMRCFAGLVGLPVADIQRRAAENSSRVFRGARFL
jgi:hypothetical protein